MGPGDVTPYPWGRLEPMSRSAVREAGRVRRAFAPALRTDTLARALGELLTSDVRIVVRKVGPRGSGGGVQGVELETLGGAARVVVDPEPGLTTAVLARLLARAVPMADPRAPLDRTSAGALAAVCIEAVRRTGTALTLAAASEASPNAGGTDGLRLDATVLLDEKPYAVALSLFSDTRPTSGDPTPDLALLSDLPVTLSLVAAVSEGRRSDVESLCAGDVWLPGDGWLHRNHAPSNEDAPVLAVPGRAALASPTLERGVETGRSDDGRIVVRPGIIALAAADGPATANGERRAMSEANEASTTGATLVALALDAPVAVRVEVASVTLTAREWAKLGPGDVIETGVRLAEPVVLRVAGREVARGELVSVDGELGVRIQEILDPGRSP